MLAKAPSFVFIAPDYPLQFLQCKGHLHHCKFMPPNPKPGSPLASGCSLSQEQVFRAFPALTFYFPLNSPRSWPPSFHNPHASAIPDLVLFPEHPIYLCIALSCLCSPYCLEFSSSSPPVLSYEFVKLQLWHHHFTLWSVLQPPREFVSSQVRKEWDQNLILKVLTPLSAVW